MSTLDELLETQSDYKAELSALEKQLDAEIHNLEELEQELGIDPNAIVMHTRNINNLASMDYTVIEDRIGQSLVGLSQSVRDANASLDDLAEIYTSGTSTGRISG